MKTLRELRAALPLVLALGACSSILGIEDIHSDPKPGSDDDGGDGSLGGTGSGSGGKGGTSGTSGKGGTSGSVGTGGVSGSAGTGGAAGDPGGADTGGSNTGGTAGSGGAGDMTVRGHVMSYWRTPLPNVVVTIGTADDVTDENGAFEIPDVAPEYDVKFALSFVRTNSAATHGWVFEGLTRRDPWLQAYLGPTERSGDVDITPTGAVEATGRYLAIAFGMPTGETTWGSSSFNGWSGASVYWEGAPMVTARWHGLVWDSDSNGLPTGYRSYATGMVALSEAETGSIAPDLTDRATGSVIVSGTVTSPTSAARTNNVFVRFPSSAKIELVEQYGSELTDPTTFSYVVPTLGDGGSVTISATEGLIGSGPAACAHRGGLIAGQTGINLTIPTPAVIVAPADVATVNETTMFRFTGGTPVTLVRFENNEFNDPYSAIFVVTTRKQLTIPTFPDGFELIQGSEHYWRVETHGDYADVDAATGPEGYANSMRSPYASNACDEPIGRLQGDGAFSMSGGRLFTPGP